MSLGTVAVSSPLHHRQSATLIPVTLRILDDSGRHRITEPIVGILTDISSEEFRVSVTGPAGRPLARTLGRRRKIQLSFINDELHEMIEGLVCEHLETRKYQPAGDAQVVRLSVPQLPTQLFDEIFVTLRRYAPPERKRHTGYIAGILAVLLVLTGGLYYRSILLRTERRPPTLGSARMRQQVAVLSETVDDLASQLEEADHEIENLRGRLKSAKRAPTNQVSKQSTPSSEKNGAPELSSKAPSPNRIRLKGASWQDFEQVRAIRGTHPAPQLGFEAGNIELTNLSQAHRQTTSMLTRLLSAYALSHRLDLRVLGALSVESADARLSIEPDVGFAVGQKADLTPDFVFDHCSPSDKEILLSRYRTIGIQEVWLHSEDKLEVFVLSSDLYVRRETSQMIPDLNIQTLASYIKRSDQTAATREFIASISAN